MGFTKGQYLTPKSTSTHKSTQYKKIVTGSYGGFLIEAQVLPLKFAIELCLFCSVFVKFPELGKMYDSREASDFY